MSCMCPKKKVRTDRTVPVPILHRHCQRCDTTMYHSFNKVPKIIYIYISALILLFYISLKGTKLIECFYERKTEVN